MVWPIPQPGDVFNRATAIYEIEYQRIYTLKNPNGPAAVVDARSPYSTLAADAKVLDMAAFDLWTFQARTAQELMVDSASDWLPRHGAQWGVPQILATAATGNTVFTAGATGVTVPAGLALSAPGGAAYVTTGSLAIAPSASGSVGIAALVTGSAGSLAPGTVLTVVSPLAGLAQQTAAVDSGGLTGEDAESTYSWKARIQARIRKRGTGGNADDFVQWTHEVFPTVIAAATSPGLGLATVAFAMPSGQTWRVPTAPEIATLSAYLNDPMARKSLGLPVVSVIAAALQPVNFSIHLNPDTVATEAAAVNALTAQMLADAVIPDALNPGTIFMSRMDAALANADGEFSHERAAPSADVVPPANTLCVIGTVTFT